MGEECETLNFVFTLIQAGTVPLRRTYHYQQECALLGDREIMALHRRRQRQVADDNSDPSAATHREDSCEDDAVDRQPSSHKHKNSISTSNQNVQDTKTTKQSFYVTKFVILRLVGFVYFIAFIGAYYQNQGLMGSNGLVPAYKYMEQLRANYDSPIQGFMSHPTIYWFISSTKLEDWHLDATAAIGTLLSILVILNLLHQTGQFILMT